MTERANAIALIMADVFSTKTAVLGPTIFQFLCV